MIRKNVVYMLATGCLLFLLLASCGSTSKSSAVLPQKINATGTAIPENLNSIVRFALSGGRVASYTLQAARPISKLRHGHREFTINVVDANTSVFIVFYGYQGPGKYVLSQFSNGGDVHIGLGKEAASWDLTMRPRAQCTLNVESDVAMQGTGIDRMKGSFTCPWLYSSTPEHPQQPVAVQSGTFDIAIIVES